LALVNDVLDLAKLEAHGEQLEPEAIDLHQAALDAITVIAPLAEEQELTVELPAAAGIPSVMADRRRLHQVFLNLLSNAVKFTEPGGAIGVALDQTDESVEVTVWDTGIGIADENQHLLFEPFQQIDGSLTREHQGSGLGQALSARLIELHGGSIAVESEPGEGTRFTVRLPQADVSTLTPAG
jgi:signal transduction histidine kinase